MKRSIRISRNHVNHFLGVIAGCTGIGLFIYSSYISPIHRTSTESVKAATTQYNTQWLMTQIRTIQVFRKAVPARGFSRAQPRQLLGEIDAGPAEWQVRSCIGANFSTEGDHASFGSCPPGSTTVNETWTVPTGSWAVPRNLGSVAGGDIPLDAAGYSRPRLAIPASDNLRINISGGEGRGWAFRSGLYGIMFATDDGIDSNGSGKWWAYSEMPLKWRVSGSITTP
jgi:hypothetical protein